MGLRVVVVRPVNVSTPGTYLGTLFETSLQTVRAETVCGVRVLTLSANCSEVTL